MIGTPIAFGLTMIVCFTLFYYYWRIRQLRARLLSAQTTPVQDVASFPVDFGIGKNVVETFPTIKACELKCTASEDLQCPICLVEYEEWEVLRQLPFCGHIFHTLCVGAWFEKQTTCPVCRMSMSELTESFGDSLVAESIRMRCRSRTPHSDVTVVEVDIDSNAPSWMTHNRRLPLPTPPVPQEERKHTCAKSQDATKPIKPVTSDAPEVLHQQSEVQILVFQTIIQRRGETSEESFTPHEAFSSQATSAIISEFSTTQPISHGAVNCSRCHCAPDDSSLSSVAVEVQEDVQTAGSFEFQPEFLRQTVE